MMPTSHPDDPRHLANCEFCQQAARQQAAELGVDLYRVWGEVAAEIWSPQIGRFEAIARRVLRSPGLARALVTTPSLLLSWIGASGFVVLIGIIATRSTDTPWAQLLAPVIAAAGIAYSYGPAIDPAFELSRSMAISDRMVLIVRALAIYGLNTLFGLIATLLAPAATGVTLGWLAPMAAIAGLALAVATVTQSPAVGAGAGIGVWAVIVLASKVGAGDLSAPISLRLAPIYLMVTILAFIYVRYAAANRVERNPSWG